MKPVLILLLVLTVGKTATAEPASNGLPEPAVPASFSWAGWVRTSCRQAVLMSTSSPDPQGRPRWKNLCASGDELSFSGNASGSFNARIQITDNQWHHVAFVADHAAGKQFIYVDGELKATGTGNLKADAPGATWKIGRGVEDAGDTFYTYIGQMDDVRIHGRALTANEVRAAMTGSDLPANGAPALRLPLDGDPTETARLGCGEGLAFVEGKFGKAAEFNGFGYIEVAADLSDAHFMPCAYRFGRDDHAWEQEDGLRQPCRGAAEQAQRYAEATGRRWPALADKARTMAKGVRDVRDLGDLHNVYRGACLLLEAERARPKDAPNRLAVISNYLAQLQSQPGTRFDPASVSRRSAALASEAQVLGNAAAVSALVESNTAIEALQAEVSRAWLLAQGIETLVFIKRLTYNANHYYTEYINSSWMPGGNLCLLDLKDGSTRDLLPDMTHGVFERFDVSFDAKHIVFAWKSRAREGYRIYEVNADGTGLRQILAAPADEAELVRNYNHGTNDMSPCYLPDGGIAFISTRCQYGTLCDSPDNFTTTTLFRMDADGKNMRQLTTSALSESSPVMLEDGRLLYTRWEYVDKGAVSVKCLWTMRPDGSGSSEVYGNDIAVPPTLIFGRGIPGMPGKYVVVGAPHFPQMAVGTVIRLDMKKNIRTREPMTYLTPYTDIRSQGGFSFRKPDGLWYDDGHGRGPLFRDPYPLSERHVLVAHKPSGPEYRDPSAYGLYLLDEQGGVLMLHRDPGISCWQPYPLRPRSTPPVLSAATDPALARKDLAHCVVADVYHGLTDVPRGTIKFIRVLEQRPRPWTARRYYVGDLYDQQHAVITKDTHLGLKVQHGVVPVEDDGSASFLVPANASIFLQVLDENYMAVQTERTFVNYMPGEMRSCIGCHETPHTVTQMTHASGTPQALLRPASMPGPQPGEQDGHRTLDYAQDVQPVWDKHCLKCHSGSQPKGKLNLSGDMTELFNVSYESLIKERRAEVGLLGLVVGENHPKIGNVEYLPARSLGSHSSVLVAMLGKGKVKLADPKQAERAAKLAEVHKNINLTPEELLKVTNWVDTNGQYYGSWWGRRNLKYKGMTDFRPLQTFEMATTNINPYPSRVDK